MTPITRYKHNVHIKCFRNKRLEEVPILYDAMEFFLDNLFKRCTLDYKLNVLVTLRNGSIVDHEDGSTNVGLAEDTEIDGVRWFKIDLSNDLPFLELLTAMAHESVHVVQFATGRLQSQDNWIWDGVDYGPNPYKDDDKLDRKLPWEYDAYRKEVELSRKFIKKFYST